MNSPRPILIAQITDLHIKPKGELAYGRVDTARALEALIHTLNALAPAPDLVVISGDLVDGGTNEEYSHLIDILRQLNLPFAVTAGNHDDRAAARRAFPDQPFVKGSALNQTRQVGPLDIIMLDSSVPEQPHGLLDDETLVWLDQHLQDNIKRPALLFLHHPVFAMGIWHMDEQPLRNSEALAAIVTRHDHVALVAAGHAHRAVVSSFAGTIATVCPAPSHAVALDLDQRQEPAFQIEPPAFHLHAWLPQEQKLVTHHVPVGVFDGPRPFFSPAGELL
jgi:3',5'-cyclic-AMP phosphodiesterase